MPKYIYRFIVTKDNEREAIEQEVHSDFEKPEDVGGDNMAEGMRRDLKTSVSRKADRRNLYRKSQDKARRRPQLFQVNNVS